MKYEYEKPYVSIILFDAESVITASETGPLIPGIDIGDDNLGAND